MKYILLLLLTVIYGEKLKFKKEESGLVEATVVYLWSLKCSIKITHNYRPCL